MDQENRRRRSAAREYRVWLAVWYLPAFLLALAIGLWGPHRVPSTLLLFGLLEVITVVYAAVQDDWGDDFRGDREVLVRGTLANAAVVCTVMVAALS